MAHRGRGCQEIRDTRSAFYLTTNDMVTLLAAPEKSLRERHFEAPTVFRKAPPSGEDDLGWGPMYARESDSIGKGVPMSDSKLAQAVGSRVPPHEAARRKALGKHPVLYQPGEETRIGIAEVGTKARDAFSGRGGNAPVDPVAAAAVMQAYRHTPKQEHPLKTTSNNVYGVKAPTAATYAFTRRARLQAFSNGFNSVKYRDMGLNTSITKSAVHTSLDPQFA